MSATFTCDDCGIKIRITSDELFCGNGVCTWVGSIKSASATRGIDRYEDRWRGEIRHLCAACRRKAARAAAMAQESAQAAGRHAYVACLSGKEE